MRIRVALTPAEKLSAPIGVAIDVLRATTTISQALAAGYRRVICTSEVDEARAIAVHEGDCVLGGERNAVRIEGFDFGNSPSEYVGAPAAGTLVFSTTNGTPLLVSAAERCETVLLGSLATLELERSSGHPVLDRAAERIVRMGAPYANFPADIRRDTDILVITRTWHFAPGDKVFSE